MKKILLLLALTVTACGTDEPTTKPAPVAETPDLTVVRYDKACLDKKAIGLNLARNQKLCKTLVDGSIHTFIIKLGDEEVDPSSCAITFDNQGLYYTLAEMDFKEC